MNIADLPPTSTAPAFGAVVYKLGESASYAAADDGTIKTIQVGGLKRVPLLSELKRVLGPDASDEHLAAMIGRIVAKEEEIRAAKAARRKTPQRKRAA